jgi:iron complex outermembrane receptor protein
MHQRNAFNGLDPSFLPDYAQDGGGVFVIERFAWERIELEGGARYDGMRRVSELDDRAYLPFQAQGRLPAGCERTADGGTCPTTFHAPSGSLGALWRPLRRAPGFVIEADAQTAARFPSTDEQFIKGSAPAFPVFSNGNGRLGTERTWGGGLTVGFANDWIWSEGAAYANFIADYIYFRADPQTPAESDCAPLTCGVQGAFPLFEPTAVDALFYGGELAGKLQPPKWPVAFEAQGSWVRARQLPSGAPVVFIPPDRYRLGVTYYWPDVRGTDNGFVTVGGTIVDRQRRYDVEADFTTPPPAYGLLHAGLGIEVPFSGQRFKAALHGSNLTNTRYRDYTSLLRYFANEPGWELMLRLTLEFDFPGRRRGL